MDTEQATVPYGYCHCGCGGRTTLWKASSAPRGRVKGEPKRYIHGHHRRGLVSNQAAIKWREENRGYETPCWIWQLNLSFDGYGRKWLGNRRVHAHRWTYEQAKGPIPEGLEVDHLCFQKQCVNPDHLEAVTRQENLRRRDARRNGQPAVDLGHPRGRTCGTLGS